MSTANTLDTGGFGLQGARLMVDSATPPDLLAFDALCLVDQALAVFNSTPDDQAHDLHFAGLSLLRQARILIGALQMTPGQGAAAKAAEVAA